RVSGASVVEVVGPAVVVVSSCSFSTSAVFAGPSSILGREPPPLRARAVGTARPAARATVAAPTMILFFSKVCSLFVVFAAATLYIEREGPASQVDQCGPDEPPPESPPSTDDDPLSWESPDGDCVARVWSPWDV